MSLSLTTAKLLTLFCNHIGIF